MQVFEERLCVGEEVKSCTFNFFVNLIRLGFFIVRVLVFTPLSRFWGGDVLCSVPPRVTLKT